MTKFIVPEIQTKFGNIELYDYQVDAVEKVINHCRTSIEPAYVYASVSAGKSLMIAAIANHFERVNEAARDQGFSANHKVLMIVRTGDLVRQNSDEAWDINCKNSIWCAGLGLKSTAYNCIMGSEKSVYNALRKELKDFAPTIILNDESHTTPYDNQDTQMMQMINEFRRRNKNVRIIGFTGSPWRGRESILDGDFWKKELVKIDRNYLTRRNFVMPVEFGFGTGDAHYDSIADGYAPEETGDCDFTASQLAEMEEKILKEGTRTHHIMLDVMKAMQNRNVALITCSGRKHCEDAAKYLPKGSYAIVDQSTSTIERLAIKEKCNNGQLKYVLQIGCWTVGISIPRIDTIVIMRLIGSMVVYEQLVGRGVRKLKQKDIDAGIIKNECLVLDYTDTSETMAALFSSDELDKAEKKRAEANNEDMQACPKCGTENSLRARRCCGVDNSGERCDFFFSFKVCDDLYTHNGSLLKKGCGTQNDPSSKTCRHCGGFMSDPNEKLLNQAYTNSDFIEVKSFSFGLTKAGDKVLAVYKLANGVTAKEIFDIQSREKWVRAAWWKFINDHVVSEITKKKMLGLRTPKKALEYVGEVRAPKRVTHRRNDRNFDLIARKEFE